MREARTLFLLLLLCSGCLFSVIKGGFRYAGVVGSCRCDLGFVWDGREESVKHLPFWDVRMRNYRGFKTDSTDFNALPDSIHSPQQTTDVKREMELMAAASKIGR